MKASPKLPFLHSLFWIVSSTLIISGISYKLIQKYMGKQKKGELFSEQKISYIVQTGFQREALHSDYLAELLGLSLDHPAMMCSFNEEIAREKLLSSPVIQEGFIRKIAPNMIYIDYTVRKPIGWVFDFINIAVDKDGYLFPVYPFFSPKKLPEMYLGKEFNQEFPSFNKPLKNKYMDLAFSILDVLKEQGKDLFMIKRVDVSNAFAPSLGKREIVVVLENELLGVDSRVCSTHFLRLSSKYFSKEIANYLTLRSHLLDADKQEVLQGNKSFQERVIDLRITQLAFIH